MKRNICIALCVLLAAAPAPARALEWEIKDVTHTVAAKVGESSFTIDGKEISLPEGTEVYKKDGYVMLPAEPLLETLDKKLRRAAGDAGPKITYSMGGHSILIFDLEKNTAVLNDVPVELTGGIELRGGHLHAPLRGLKNILSAYGYQADAGDLTWNEAAQTATLRVTSAELLAEGADRETPAAKGEGDAPVYAVPPTRKYGRLENLGGGYFLAESGKGLYGGGMEKAYYVLDGTGKELQKQGGGDTDIIMEDLGEGCFQVEEYRRVGKELHIQRRVVDRNGKTLFSLPENWEIGRYSPEGLANAYNTALDTEKNTAAFLDLEGRLVFAGRYRGCRNFSEGLAPVRTDKGWGYIDKNGKEAIAPQFSWAGGFYDGKAFVRIGEETWVIDRTGQKWKRISENGLLEPVYKEAVPGILREEIIADLEGRNVLGETGDHIHLQTFYDTEGEIPPEKQAWAVNGAEGLMAFRDTATGKYGYVDEGYNWVIAPVFDEAGKFRDGYAAVCRGGSREHAEWGVIKMPQALPAQ